MHTKSSWANVLHLCSALPMLRLLRMQALVAQLQAVMALQALARLKVA